MILRVNMAAPTWPDRTSVAARKAIDSIQMGERAKILTSAKSKISNVAKVCV